MSSLSVSALRTTDSRAGPTYVSWDAQSFHQATDRATDSHDHFPSGGSTACHWSASVNEKCLASPARSVPRPRMGPCSGQVSGRSVLSTASPRDVCTRTPSLPASTAQTGRPRIEQHLQLDIPRLALHDAKDLVLGEEDVVLFARRYDRHQVRHQERAGSGVEPRLQYVRVLDVAALGADGTSRRDLPAACRLMEQCPEDRR